MELYSRTDRQIELYKVNLKEYEMGGQVSFQQKQVIGQALSQSSISAQLIRAKGGGIRYLFQPNQQRLYR